MAWRYSAFVEIYRYLSISPSTSNMFIPYVSATQVALAAGLQANTQQLLQDFSRALTSASYLAKVDLVDVLTTFNTLNVLITWPYLQQDRGSDIRDKTTESFGHLVYDHSLNYCSIFDKFLSIMFHSHHLLEICISNGHDNPRHKCFASQSQQLTERFCKVAQEMSATGQGTTNSNCMAVAYHLNGKPERRSSISHPPMRVSHFERPVTSTICILEEQFNKKIVDAQSPCACIVCEYHC